MTMKVISWRKLLFTTIVCSIVLAGIIFNIVLSAAVMGAPTFVCDFSGKRHAIDFVELGLCLGCFPPDKIRPTVERLLFDQDARNEMYKMFLEAVRRFNGPSDGRSASRIADHMLGKVGCTGEHQCQP